MQRVHSPMRMRAEQTAEEVVMVGKGSAPGRNRLLLRLSHTKLPFLPRVCAQLSFLPSVTLTEREPMCDPQAREHVPSSLPSCLIAHTHHSSATSATSVLGRCDIQLIISGKLLSVTARSWLSHVSTFTLDVVSCQLVHHVCVSAVEIDVVQTT